MNLRENSLGDFTRIGHLNIVNVKALTMETGSKMGHLIGYPVWFLKRV